MKKQKKLQDFRDYVVEDLKKHPETIPVYLEVSLEEYEKDGDIAALLLAIRTIAEAKGRISDLARETHLSRQNLYKIFSNKVSPRFNTLTAILRSLGFTLSLKKIDAA
jgi:probable addiction module antidote protein